MSILQGIRSARERIDAALQAAGRTDDIELQLAVKTRSPQDCYAAALALEQLGLPVLLGHNRVQEATATLAEIRRCNAARIHLIGPLQSNKINHAIRCVDAIDTIDRIDLIDRLDARLNTALPVLVQVNVSAEATKSGVAPAQALRFVDAIMDSAHLRFDGYMTVGLNSPEEKPVRTAYSVLRKLRDNTAERIGVDPTSLTLSMGMSGDLEWAIAEGATRVRLGTAIFGARH
ncbi:YggS family pyridoxal phosphate-dependent enzyme [Schaalia suimastitidis]|uniref:YggS family pyridoxal phosphate-dependent enzyme n=1 Tax=Schaalia suimastitidis TaxID=121163 RepID=UPI00040100CA|nr:YggS family pyridoxal phosphate-dependent enzyme [Schaalia suimastitidis]